MNCYFLLKALISTEARVPYQSRIASGSSLRLSTIILTKRIHILDILTGLKPIWSVKQAGYLKLAFAHKAKLCTMFFHCFVELFSELHTAKNQYKVTNIQTQVFC